MQTNSVPGRASWTFSATAHSRWLLSFSDLNGFSSLSRPSKVVTYDLVPQGISSNLDIESSSPHRGLFGWQQHMRRCINQPALPQGGSLLPSACSRLQRDHQLWVCSGGAKEDQLFGASLKCTEIVWTTSCHMIDLLTCAHLRPCSGNDEGPHPSWQCWWLLLMRGRIST